MVTILIDKKDIHETPIRKIISPGGGGGGDSHMEGTGMLVGNFELNP